MFKYEKYNGSVPTIELREYSCNKIANIIYVDSPVWTGFSYATGSKDEKIGDIKSSKQIYQFIQTDVFKCDFCTVDPNIWSSSMLILSQPSKVAKGIMQTQSLLNAKINLEALDKKTLGEWQRSVDVPYVKDVESSIKCHINLATRGYLILIYSDHDLKVSFVDTMTWIRSLNFSTIDDWWPWFVDGQVAVYTRMYSNNLTFETVKGAGHTAPKSKSKECLAMIQQWISHDPF